MQKIAHISDLGKPEPIIDHLMAVAKRAYEFAKPFGFANWAYNMGLYHDIGKFSDEFQNRILHNGEKIDHSTAGAYEIYRANLYPNNPFKVFAMMCAYCIAGHHAGLSDGGTRADAEDEGTLWARFNGAKAGNLPDYSDFKKQVPKGLAKVPEEFSLSPVTMRQQDIEFTLTFLCRMLFSCLVDADWLETERFMRSGQVPHHHFASIDELQSKFEKYNKAHFSNPQTKINKLRCEVSNQAYAAADSPQGFFSLTVPTGGGKTMASMRFALRHAKKHNLQRIIYAIPYTSIISQNAKTFKRVLGKTNVLEHHGAYDFSDDVSDRLKRASENWDVPIVVTTNVQFFESLYHARTSRTRKLHNIVNSVIILDEVQALPTQELEPCLRALVELEQNYGCTIVFSTATQPNLKAQMHKWKRPVKEIISNPKTLHKLLKRVRYRDLKTISNEELISRLAKEKQALCVVNNKRQAQELYAMLSSKRGSAKGLYHLSTSMYPKHIQRTIREIQNALSDPTEPCLVISTSVIEAGVDLDFPCVYRQRAGLDSMIQAAGRCNRNNNAKAIRSFVNIFDSVEDYNVPQDVSQKRSITDQTINSVQELNSLDTIDRYFKYLYGFRNLDKEGVLHNLSDPNLWPMQIPFRTASKNFNLIKENTIPIVFPNRITHSLLLQVETGLATSDTFRTLELYTVSVYENQKDKLLPYLRAINLRDPNTSSVQASPDDEEDVLYVLKDTKLYNRQTGLIQLP